MSSTINTQSSIAKSQVSNQELSGKRNVRNFGESADSNYIQIVEKAKEYNVNFSDGEIFRELDFVKEQIEQEYEMGIYDEDLYSKEY